MKILLPSFSALVAAAAPFTLLGTSMPSLDAGARSTNVEASGDNELPFSLEFDLASKTVGALCVVEGTIRIRCSSEAVGTVEQAWFDDSDSDTKAYLCIAEQGDVVGEPAKAVEVTVGWLAFGYGFSAYVDNPEDDPSSIWHTLDGLGYGSKTQRLHDGGTLEMVIPVGIDKVLVDPDVVGARSIPGVLFHHAGAVYSIHMELRKAAEVLLASTPSVIQVVGNGLEPAVQDETDERFAKNRCAWMLLGMNAFVSPARQLNKEHRLIAEDALKVIPPGTPVHEALTMLCVECDLDRPMHFVRENKPGTSGFAGGVLAELDSLAACTTTLDSFVHLPTTQPSRTAAAKRRAAQLTEALSK